MALAKILFEPHGEIGENLPLANTVLIEPINEIQDASIVWKSRFTVSPTCTIKFEVLVSRGLFAIATSYVGNILYKHFLAWFIR